MTAEVLRRYTNLAATIHSLTNRTLTLLNPQEWDDKNDAYFMQRYKEQKSVQSVLALCFAETNESYHHWRVFSDGLDGVCIQFDKEMLLDSVRGHGGIKFGKVTYKTIKTLRRLKPKTEQLPYLKRLPYKDEKEFRLVHVHSTEKEAEEFSISLACITRVTLSPWLPKPLKNAVRSAIRNIEGCENLEIIRSTLIGNELWKRVADSSKS